MTEHQIVSILEEAEAGIPVKELFRKSSKFSKGWERRSEIFIVKESLFAGSSGKFALFESTWEVLGDGAARLIIYNT